MNESIETAPLQKKVPGELPPDKFTHERITWISKIAPHLFRFKTTRYAGFRFVAGQFARLGVYRDDKSLGPRYVWRAYSIASATYDDYLEFYSIVVPDGEFTTKLAKLNVGDEVLVEKTNYGYLTTDRFEGGSELWLLSSGTGLAPFISILGEFAVWQQFRKIIVVHSVRNACELAYRDVIASFRTHDAFSEFFESDAERLVYIPIVTREPTSVALHERIPVAIKDGTLEEAVGVRLDPVASRVMICGNPEMVDDTRKLLQSREFRVSRRGQPGNMAVENYW